VRASTGPPWLAPNPNGTPIKFSACSLPCVACDTAASQSTRRWLAVSPALPPASVEPIVLGALCCLVRFVRVTASDSLFGGGGLLRWLFSFLQGSATCRMACISVTFFLQSLSKLLAAKPIFGRNHKNQNWR
jgi:hypothetical protein